MGYNPAPYNPVTQSYNIEYMMIVMDYMDIIKPIPSQHEYHAASPSFLAVWKE